MTGCESPRMQVTQMELGFSCIFIAAADPYRKCVIAVERHVYKFFFISLSIVLWMIVWPYFGGRFLTKASNHMSKVRIDFVPLPASQYAKYAKEGALSSFRKLRIFLLQITTLCQGDNFETLMDWLYIDFGRFFRRLSSKSRLYIFVSSRFSLYLNPSF